MNKLSLAFIPVLFFCGSAFSQRAISAISLVPGRSVAVLSFDWNKVRRDGELNRMVRGDELADLLEQIGAPGDRVNEVAMFADLDPTPSNKLGMIVSGRFASAAIIKSLEARDWQKEKIGARIAYKNPADGSYLMVLSGGVFVAGTRAAVEQTGAVLSNPRNAMVRRAGFGSIMSHLGPAAPVRFFIGIPEEYKAVADFAFKIATKLMSFTGMGIMGMIFDKIGLIQSMGFAMSARGDFYPVHLVVAMPDKTRAAVASGGLNLIKKGAWMLKEESLESRALKTMVIESSGNLLSIKFDMPKNALPPRH